MKNFLLGEQMLAVIFDFNGVIINDSWLHELAWKEVIYELTGNQFNDETIKKTVHGRINREIFNHVLKRDLSADEAEQLSELKECKYRKLFIENIAKLQIDGSIEKIFNYLTKQQIPFTIATASGLKNLQFFMQQLGLDRWFNIEKISYDDGSIPGKPHPQIYLNAAQNIESDINRCIVIEDAITGVQSAKAAGAGIIIGYGVSHPHDELKQHGANLIMNSFDEFPYEQLENKAF